MWTAGRGTGGGSLGELGCAVARTRADWCRFYEAQGFVWVGDYLRERPGKEIGPFEGAFFRMEL